MELVVELIHPRHRLMFEVLAATGLRRSEILALEGRHLELDGDHPCVKVRQRVRRLSGSGLLVGPLKSRYARRDVPISLRLAGRLKALHVAPDALVFPSQAGTMLDGNNVSERVLGPACEEAGVEWAGWHTFRHTVASRLFASGRNAVQVQRWLGHHSPAFTLATYVHLLDGDVGEPLAPQSANKVQTDPTPIDTTTAELAEAESLV
jgi:integrase